MKKKRAESAIPPQIKIVGYPCLISPKSFSMNEEKFFICDRVDDHGDDGATLRLHSKRSLYQLLHDLDLTKL